MKRKWGGKKPKDPTERFWSKVDKSGNCWNWTGLKFHFGHGSFSIGSRWDNSNRSIGAHRYSWEIHNGKIPNKLCVLHKCDNPSCVKPEHLFLGTRLDNNIDMKHKGRIKTLRGQFNGASKLTSDEVNEIRKLYSKNFRISDLAIKFNISTGNVRHIVRRESWKHI